MPFNLGFQTKFILSPWSMHFKPVKVSFNGFAILFEILSAHCVSENYWVLWNLCQRCFLRGWNGRTKMRWQKKANCSHQYNDNWMRRKIIWKLYSSAWFRSQKVCSTLVGCGCLLTPFMSSKQERPACLRFRFGYFVWKIALSAFTNSGQDNIKAYLENIG